MATANKFLEQPARGSNVGVWDTPVNANMGIIDNSFGGMATVALTNAPVILSSAQYQCAFITFTGALSGTCAITFPVVGSWYTVQNLTTNTSAFQVTLQTTAAGSQAIGCPWGEPFDIMTDASGNVKFRSLDRVGSLWEYGGSSVPAWVSNCTVPPFLNCDGTSFSSATYPVLATILGSVTLPDLRGRYRVNLNQGTGRITAAAGGINGDTNLTSGGQETRTLSSQHIPPVPINDPGHTHSIPFGSVNFITGGPTDAVRGTATSTTGSNTTGITAGNAVAAAFATLPPTAVVGITMIRSA